MRPILSYEQDIQTAQVLPEWRRDLTKVTGTLQGIKKHYEGFDVPWDILAVIHMREASNNFDRQILNGQKINMTTTLVPAGRGPWASWRESTLEAIEHHNMAAISNAPLAEQLQFLERWNGMGYYKRNKKSPYVWSGTQHGLKVGKFIADGKYDANAVDRQPGAGTVLLILRGELQILPTEPQPVEVTPTTVIGIGSRDYEGDFRPVTSLQLYLNGVGPKIKVDGKVGPETASAFYQVFGVRMKGDVRG